MKLASETPVTEIELPRSEQAYSQIRTDILHGHIPPGEKLKLELLQSTYGFSNTPLREALNRLAAENLVISDERRGFRASPVSLADFLDLTAYRLVIERSAFADAIENGGDEWEANILATHHRMEIAQGRTGRDRAALYTERTRRHKDFHMALIGACGSKRLVSSCSAMFDQAERYRRISSQNRMKPRDARNEHRQLMELALARKETPALALLKDHVLRTADRVSDILK